MNNSILITGATGFLGSHILRKLVERKENVILLKRSTSNLSRIEDLLARVKIFNSDKDDLDIIFKNNKVSTVIHTATNYGRNGENVLDIADTNIMFGLKLLTLSLKYSVNLFINTDTAQVRDLNFYSHSKKQFSDWCKFLSKSSDMKLLNLCLEQMYGPEDDSTKFVTWLVREFQSNKASIDFTEGKQLRDFIYVDDVVNVFIFLINNSTRIESNYKDIEIGSGNPITIRNFIETVFKIVNKYQKCNTNLNFGKIPLRHNEISDKLVDTGYLFGLGWRPKFTLEQGLSKIIEYELEMK